MKSRQIHRSLLAIVTLMLVAASCGGSDDPVATATGGDVTETTLSSGAPEGDATATTAAAADSGGSDTTAADTTQDTAGGDDSTATTAAAGGGGASPDDPLPLTGATFTYDETFGDAQFAGVIDGMIEGQPSEFNDVAGRCFFVVGRLTPTQLGEEDISNSFSAPTIAMVLDGRVVDSTFGECEDQGIIDAGYSWIFNMSVTEGTSFDFYDEFFLPDTGTTEPGPIAVGDTSGGSAIYYQPDLIGSIPTPPAPIVGPNTFLDGAPALPGSRFTYTDEFAGATWDGELIAVVETEIATFFDIQGTCLTVVGAITPTELTEGVTTTGFDTPSVDMIVNGRQIGSGFGCDEDALEAAGYEWILNAEVTVGTRFPFYQQFLVPEGTTAVDAVMVGSVFDDQILYYSVPNIGSEIPAPG